MEDAWWGPTVPLAGVAPWFALSERNSPGSIIVNMRSSGKRFMKRRSRCPTSKPAITCTAANTARVPARARTFPAWLVFDQQYRDRRYIFAGLQPGQP